MHTSKRMGRRLMGKEFWLIVREEGQLKIGNPGDLEEEKETAEDQEELSELLGYFIDL
jgi:hypothetical protein